MQQRFRTFQSPRGEQVLRGSAETKADLPRNPGATGELGQPLGGGGLRFLAAVREQTQHQGASRDVRRDVSGSFRPLGKRRRFHQRLLATAQIGEVERGGAGYGEPDLANAAPLAKLDSLAAKSQRRLRSFVLLGGQRDLALNHAGVATLSPFDRELERLAQVRESPPIAQGGARSGRDAEPTRRLGQAKL